MKSLRFKLNWFPCLTKRSKKVFVKSSLRWFYETLKYGLDLGYQLCPMYIVLSVRLVNWIEEKNVPPRFTRAVGKLVRMNGVDGISIFG